MPASDITRLFPVFAPDITRLFPVLTPDFPKNLLKTFVGPLSGVIIEFIIHLCFQISVVFATATTKCYLYSKRIFIVKKSSSQLRFIAHLIIFILLYPGLDYYFSTIIKYYSIPVDKRAGERASRYPYTTSKSVLL